MNVLYVLAGVIGFGLFVYLFVALLVPEALERRGSKGGKR